MNRLPEIKAFIKDVVEVGKYGDRVSVLWTHGHAPTIHMQDDKGTNVESVVLTSEWTVDQVKEYLSERGFDPIKQEKSEL